MVSFPADLARWHSVRNTIYEEVQEKGWNKNRKAFVQHYGSDTLDASVLIMPLVFFMSPTIRALYPHSTPYSHPSLMTVSSAITSYSDTTSKQLSTDSSVKKEHSAFVSFKIVNQVKTEQDARGRSRCCRRRMHRGCAWPRCERRSSRSSTPTSRLPSGPTRPTRHRSPVRPPRNRIRRLPQQPRRHRTDRPSRRPVPPPHPVVDAGRDLRRVLPARPGPQPAQVSGVCALVQLTLVLGLLLNHSPWCAVLVPLTVTALILTIAYNPQFALLMSLSLTLATVITVGGRLSDLLVAMGGRRRRCSSSATSARAPAGRGRRRRGRAYLAMTSPRNCTAARRGR